MTSIYACPAATIWKEIRHSIMMQEWDFLDVLEAQTVFISMLGIGVFTMFGIYIRAKRARQQWPIRCHR